MLLTGAGLTPFSELNHNQVIFPNTAGVSNPSGGPVSDGNFRRLGQSNKLGRELPDETYEKAVKASFLAYRVNPMAKRLIDMKVDFTLGSGLTIASQNNDVLSVLLSWWNDPYNNWPYKIYHRLRDLFIYGEWLHQPLVGISDNNRKMVFIRDLQPDTIKGGVTEIGNHSEVDQVIFRKIISGDGTVKEDVSIPVIRRRLFTGENGVTRLLPFSGDVFYFGINRTTDSIRGVGELFTEIDFLDLYDEVLFSRAEKINAMSSIYYDLTLNGMTDQEIQNYVAAETNLPPRPGTLWAHNGEAELKQVTPAMHSDDHSEDARVIKSHIVSAAGWPGTFFDDPGTAGRAVGAEMAEPAYKMVTSVQNYVAQILRVEMNYVLNAHNIKSTAYDLSFSPPSHRDIQRTGPALARLSQFIEKLGPIKGRGALLTDEEMREIVVTQVNQLGLTDMAMGIPMPLGLSKPLDMESKPTAKEAADPEATEEKLREEIRATLPRQIERLIG